MSLNKKSEKYLSAKESLPKNLQPIYDQLVEEYTFHTMNLYGKVFVAYNILSNLVRDGWRPSGKAKNKN